MRLDGMYWHYLDKWMFCLLRLGQATNDASFYQEGGRCGQRNFQILFIPGRGLHWKMTSDLRQVPGLPLPSGPGDDELAALIVFSCINEELKRLDEEILLTKEVPS